MQRAVIKILLLVTLFHGAIFAQDVNVDLIISQAKKTNKNLLILLGQAGCSYCTRMKKIISNDKQIQEYFKNDFLFEYIDIKENGTVTFKDFKGTKRKFAKHLGHKFYPTSIFINNNYNIVYSQPGVMSKDKFLLTLEFIKNESYRSMNFQDYVNKKDFEKEL